MARLDTFFLESSINSEIRTSNFSDKQKEDLERIIKKLLSGISDAIEKRDIEVTRDIC